MADESFIALEATQDPSCRIESRGISPSGVPFIVYRSATGERWRIDGECNRCGECWVGGETPSTLVWTGTPIGQAGAFEDVRPPSGRVDCPTLPKLTNSCPSCTLSGEVL